MHWISVNASLGRCSDICWLLLKHQRHCICLECTWARKPLERSQNFLYCSREVRGAYSSLMSFPTYKDSTWTVPYYNKRGLGIDAICGLGTDYKYLTILRLAEGNMCGKELHWKVGDLWTCGENRTCQAWCENDPSNFCRTLQFCESTGQLLPKLCVQRIYWLSL